MKEFIQNLDTVDIFAALLVSMAVIAILFIQYILPQLMRPTPEPLKAPDVPIRNPTGEDYVRRVRVNRAYRSGALLHITHERVDVVARCLMASEAQLRKVIRDCDHVGTEHVRPTLLVANEVMEKLLEMQLAIIPLKRAIASLDPKVEIEVSLLPEEPPLETTVKDFLLGIQS